MKLHWLNTLAAAALVASAGQASADLALAQSSGCMACHAVETKIVGPSWRDVSARYKDDPDAKEKLVQTIKSGGRGNWAQVTGGVPMPPYSPRVADADIEKLVDFILNM